MKRLWRKIALAGAALTLATPSVLAKPSECQPAESPGPNECNNVDTFSTDTLAALTPNALFHLVLDVATVDNIAVGPLSGPMRFAAGAGLLFGVAPCSSQQWRLSVGGTFLAGQWAGDNLGNYSIEPRGRVSLNVISGVFPVDLYVEGVAPYFFASQTFTPGFGAGGSLRVFSFPVELGADLLFGDGDFGRADRPASNAVRLFTSVGFDLFAATGATERAPRQQSRIDLRCDLLAKARLMAPTNATPAYCGDVVKALEGAYADREMTAMERFLKALPPNLSDPLTRWDALYSSCVSANRRTQRVCVDCTGMVLSNWFTYTVDPAQIAAALGCVPAVRPDDALCPNVDAAPALRYADRCP
jgi:hypothetical protein